MRARIGRLFDRRIALAGFAFAVVAIVVVATAVGVTRPMQDDEPARDPAVAAQLVASLARGEQQNYIVEYGFSRVRSDDGQRLTNSVTEARYGDASITLGSGTVTAQLPTTRYTCQTVDSGATCYDSQEHAPVPVSALVRTAFDTGAYDVLHARPETIAGEPGDCFRVRAAVPGDELPGLGRETVFCVGADGVPLRTQIASRLATDEWVAQRVQRGVDRAAISALLAGYDQVERRLPKQPAVVLADSFYDSVLRELVFALGAALFVANAYALYRRRADRDAAVHRTVARNRPGSPVRGYRRATEDEDLTQAPVARTIAYMVIGFIVMVAGLGAILNS